MPQWLLILLRGAALVYVGVCAALFFLQRSMLYYPQPPSERIYPTISLPTAAGPVLVCTRPREGPGAVVYFGGNSEDVSYNLPAFSAALPDRAIYLMNYRGFGGSSGKPSEAGLFEDASALFDNVHAEHADIELVGRSLGSGIAVYVASRRPVSKLVLVTPYDSIEDLAARQFPYLPVKWLLLDKYQSWEYAPNVMAPTLIIAAEHDQVIPRKSTELLCSRFRSGLVSMKILPGTDHNDINEHPEFLELLAR